MGYPNSEANFPVNGHRPWSQYGAQYGPQYRRFQDSSFSSCSDTPSIDTYLSHETRDYRYGYGPSLTQRSPRHVHSNSDVISRGPGYVSRGTIHPYSRDLSDLQESFGCELYVNQRTLTEEMEEHGKRKKKHKYEYIDDDDASDNSECEEDEHQFVNPLPLPPKRMLSKSQQSLAISPIRAMSRSQQSLASSASSPLRGPVSPYGKRPVPAPRVALSAAAEPGLGSEPGSAPVTPSKRAGSRYASNQSLCPTSHVDTVIMSNSQLVTKPLHPEDTCHICSLSLHKPGGHDPYPELPSSVISLLRCQHRFHLNCVRVVVDNNPAAVTSQSLRCPECGRLQRDVLGTMPENGTMSYKVIPKGLPGFDNYHSIQITYNFQNGTQSPKHPSPGAPYFAIGFPKTAFLPDTEQGRTILEMLEKSFNLGHTFVVDAGGDIVWGDIPHRTEFGGDPMSEAFLDTVMAALFKLGLGASDC